MATFNLRKFTNPDLLKTIAPGRLIAFLSPWREYLAKRGLALSGNGRGEIDCDVLAHILMDPDADKDCPQTRPIGPPTGGKIIAFPEIGGLHHRYERRAA